MAFGIANGQVTYITAQGAVGETKMFSPISGPPATMHCRYRADAGLTSSPALVGVHGEWTGYRDKWFRIYATRTGTNIQCSAQQNASIPANTSTNAAMANDNSFAGTFASLSSRTGYLNGGNAVTESTARANPTPFRLWIGAMDYLSLPQNHIPAGLLSEVAIWSAVLTAAEIVSLAKGFKPSRIRPQSLVFYAPLVRAVRDVKNNLALTVTGTSYAAAHPRVY